MTPDTSCQTPIAGTVLYRVSNSKFIAGFEVKNGRVCFSAPILRWARGRFLTEVLERLTQMGWQVEQVKQVKQNGR